MQPHEHPGNRYRFALQRADESWHSFDWRPGRVSFASTGSQGEPLQAWEYAGPDLPPGGQNIRFNLWLIDGKPPSDGQEVEVVVKNFEFELESEP